VLASVERHRRETGGDLFADVLSAERAGPAGGRRQRALDGVRAGRRALALRAAGLPAPPGARPARAHGAERDALAEVYLDVLGRFARRFDTPMPYIASWNQAPVTRGREDWWLHLQLFSLRRAPGS
jgi:UDPglucose--hexose-1-phosphate uridylyltransferase